MQYRRFGKADFEVSALGFGCMRLPVIGGDMNVVDEPQAIEMIRYAIDQGVSYIDTAYPYHGGNSERVVGDALKDGYRQKVKIATKLPCWEVKTEADFDRFLNEQCKRLQVDFIDIYMLHNLNATLWPQVRDLGALDWLDGIKSAGRVGEVGFSYHHNYDLFEEIVDAYDWSFCQIQYNYMNENVQAGTAGFKYASEHDLAIIIMEPLLGGCLASPPDQVRRIWDSAPRKRTPADWALLWLWSKPDVSTVLSGMSTMEQVRQNIESAGESGVGKLTEAELVLFNRAREEYERLSTVPCTQCGYCMPCSVGVEIPYNLQLYNDALVFGGVHEELNRNLYPGLPEQARASACTACRECEEKCPQSILVSEWMPKVHERFKPREAAK